MPNTPGAEDETSPLLGSEFCQIPVYPLIHDIRIDIVAHIDTPLTYEQLTAPDSTYTIIRPLTDKYLALRNPSVVFCLLLNKVQFATDSHQISISTLSSSRATLCEILAIRVLRGWSERSLPLATVLLTPWRMFQGAPVEVIRAAKDDGEEECLDDEGTALEMAIISSSKRFIRSPSCQKVIEGIWTGKIVYSSYNTHALIQDYYKRKPIQIYNPHKAPLLDHYRLKVPKIRAIIEYANFVILFLLYIWALEKGDIYKLTTAEIIFIIYALAFSLDKAAAVREHGLKVFSSSLVNGFDLGFILIFALFLGCRIVGFSLDKPDYLGLGSEILAVGAVLMFPRLAFMTLANNLMILSIRSMLAEFIFLMSVGIFCFLGFIYALHTLGEGKFSVSTLAWWLLEVYFGLDATGFESSWAIHRYLGPCLMVLYAFLSNTLLLTVAVAILGNTFATINADAAAESMFRRAVATVEGVKADSVFSYQLPFNIIAVVVLYPLSFWLNPRWFHKVNVLMIRVTNLPVLLLIALWERQTYNQSTLWEQVCDYTDHYVGKISAVTGFESSRMDISAVFDIEREFGTYYTGGVDDVFEDDDDDMHEDDGTSTPTTPNTSTPVMTMSPEQESFTHSIVPSPNVQRRRRNSQPPSLAGLPAPTGTSVPPPHLARSRRNSTVFGPSPLAQLFVRNMDESYLPQRRATAGVGSLPVLSMLGSQSPRRSRGMFAHPTGGNNVPSSNQSTHSNSSSGRNAGISAAQLSQSLNVSAMAIDERRQHRIRPSVTPIQEAVTPADSPGREQAREGRAGVLFPGNDGDAVQRVTFEEPPRPQTSNSRHSAPAVPTRQTTSPQSALAAGRRPPTASPQPPPPVTKGPTKASDLLASLEGHTDLERDKGVERQLAAMASRQERIEALLEQLVGARTGDSVPGGMEISHHRRHPPHDTWSDTE